MCLSISFARHTQRDRAGLPRRIGRKEKGVVRGERGALSCTVTHTHGHTTPHTHTNIDNTNMSVSLVSEEILTRAACANFFSILCF